MQRFKKFALDRPFLFGIALILVYAVLSTLTYPVHYLFPDSDVGMLYGDAVSKVIIFLCLLVILWRLGWLKASGLLGVGPSRIWLIAIVILIYKGLSELYAFTGSVVPVLPSSAYSIAETLYLFPASVVEETIYRSLVLVAMVSAWGDSKQGIVKSVILSSVLFGMLHLFNIIVNPIGLVLLQAVVAIMPGLFYAAIVLRGRSLWPAILMHWLTNAMLNAKLATVDGFEETPVMWMLWAISLLPIVLYGAYFVWKLPASIQLEGVEENQEIPVV